jgi:hypothetical protein
MIIDCRHCAMRDIACGECVVSHLLGAEPIASAPQMDLVASEERALRVLHGAGLVPPLRMVPDLPGTAVG